MTESASSPQSAVVQEGDEAGRGLTPVCWSVISFGAGALIGGIAMACLRRKRKEETPESEVPEFGDIESPLF
jgi:hypothetical protein